MVISNTYHHLTLIWVGGGGGNFTCWFSLNNPEKVKAVTLASYSFQLPDIEQNSDGGISDFWSSAQSFINKSFYNSRTSLHIDMKLGPVTKIHKGII